MNRTARNLMLAAAIAAALAGGAAFSTDPIESLIARAEGGDPAAQVDLGRMYLEGKGIPKDTDRALIHLQRAATAKDTPQHAARANALLANFYAGERQTPAARSKMLRHLREAAILGDVDAQTRLGRLLIESVASGELTDGNAATAREQGRKLLEHAARAGHADAAFELAQLHRYGRGLPKDAEASLRWYQAAADLGHSSASYHVATTLIDRPTPDPKGWEYMARAAKSGVTAAMIRLAEHSLEQDHLGEAMDWAADAAERGNADARRLVTAIEKRVEAREAEAEAQRLAKQEAERQAAEEAERLAAAARQAEAAALASAELAAEAGKPSVTEAPTEPEAAPAPVVTTQALAAAPAVSEAPVFEDVEAVEEGDDLSIDTLLESESRALLLQIGDLQGRLASLTEENQTLREQLAERDAMIAERDRTIAQLRSVPRTGAKPDAAAIAAAPEPRAPSDAVALNQQGLEAVRTRDFSTAVKHFEAAANLGNASAMNSLATLYLRGLGTDASVDRAVALFKQAARAGNPVGAKNLARLYAEGVGVAKDPEQARAWYQRAAALAKAGQAGPDSLAHAF